VNDAAKRLFVGIKISTALQNDLDRPAPGTQHYFQESNENSLQIVDLGTEKYIGRYIKNGFSLADIGDVGRNVCSIMKLIARGRRIDEKDVHIYAP